jgi:TubC N-terminal docking domain
MLRVASDLLRRLRDGGAELEIINGSLRVTVPEGVLTDELKRQLVELKPQLLELISSALQLLNRRGARLIQNVDRTVIGLWHDADGREVREALDVVGLGAADVLFLDDPESDIPERYRQFVPEYVKEIWSRQGLLASPAERLEAEARARYLNRLFDTFGTVPGRSHITATTVLQGMLAKKELGLP